MPPTKQPAPLVINRWLTGLVTNRNPLLTPLSNIGVSTVPRYDALIDGLNVEITPQFTLARRPGFPQTPGGTIPGTEKVLCYSDAHLFGVSFIFVDTDSAVYAYRPAIPILAAIFIKSPGAAQTSFQPVGSRVYFVDGITAKQWDSSGDATTMGIVPPATAPGVTFTDFNKTMGWLSKWAPPGVFTYGNFAPDNNGNIQLALTPLTLDHVPNWNQQFGGYTIDGANPSSDRWRNMGPNQPWVTGATVAPQTAIADSNGNFQYTIAGGVSGSTQPTWATTRNTTTSDNTVSWINVGFAGPTLAYQGWSYGYCYRSATGHCSTMSPAAFTGPIVGVMGITLSGATSINPDVTAVEIYRTFDGGPLYFFLASLPNTGSTWTYSDTSDDFNLDQELIAPTGHVNDPPPDGLSLLTFHQGRMFGAVGHLIYIAAGGDCTNGVPEEAWPPANVLVADSDITGFASTSYGLLAWTADDLFVVLGGPQTLTYYIQRAITNFGLSSENCLTQDGDQLFFYSSGRQVWSFSSDEKEEIGFSIAGTLAGTFNPSTSYVSLHRSGQDVGLFISDGSTNLIRYGIDNNQWGTIAQPVGGIGAIKSVTVGPGDQELYGTIGQKIVSRSLTTFADADAAYPANAVIGSIALATGGAEPASIEALYVQRTSAGSDVAISVLNNEITGTFVNIPLNTNYPYDLSASISVPSKRYDWRGAQSPLPQLTTHLQVKLTFPTEAAKNEVLSLSLAPVINK